LAPIYPIHPSKTTIQKFTLQKTELLSEL